MKNHHRFIKAKLHLTNTYEKMTVLVEEETAVDVVYLHFEKSWTTAFYNITIAKLGKVRID